jgi:hypothetical protein
VCTICSAPPFRRPNWTFPRKASILSEDRLTAIAAEIFTMASAMAMGRRALGSGGFGMPTRREDQVANVFGEFVVAGVHGHMGQDIRGARVERDLRK